MRPPASLQTIFIGAVLLVFASCEPTDRPRPARAVPDSSSIYGDPGLTPQRDGEHARRELATSGDLHRAIVGLGTVRDPTVVVRLPHRGSDEAARVRHW